MKKFAIGCLIVVAVLGVALAIGGYLVYQNFVKPIASSFSELATLPELDKTVANKSPFTAPANGELTEAMVARFARMQEQVEAALGTRLDDIKAKYDRIDKGFKAEGRKVGFNEGLAALKDLSAVLVEAKRVQVKALNDAGYSLDEYHWVRNQVYAAVGMAAGSFDVAEMARRGRSGQSWEPREREVGDVPEHNKTLVAPYQKRLEKWAPLAFFGL